MFAPRSGTPAPRPQHGSTWAVVVVATVALLSACGTSEELRVLDDGDQAAIDVFADHCGSSAGPNLDEAVAGELALFDLDELLATG